MPIYCRFKEDVKFHRSLANLPHEPRVIGVELNDCSTHTLKKNVGYITFDAREYVETHDYLGVGFIWCTSEEYEHNWTYLASELLRRCLRASSYDGYTVVPARDMPKFSIGVTKNLDVVARDSRGRWLYLSKTGDTIESVVSDIPPDCLVVYDGCNEYSGRHLMGDRYWVTVRGGNYVIVRPPLNCPDDINVPYGAFLNSRFVFHGDNSYVLEPLPAAHALLVGGREIVTYQSPRCAVYGQLVLHEDNNKMYMTLTPVYPDIFGCKITRKYNDISDSVFNTLPSGFCSFLSCEYNINTMDNEYDDCLDGSTLAVGHSPILCHGMPTKEATFETHFVIEDGVPHSVWLRTMSVDDEGNKIYRNVDTEKFITNLLSNADMNTLRNSILLYDGEKLRWDGRNSAWIRSEDAVYIPPALKRSFLDIYTHSRFVECETCPVCHAKTMLSDRYTFTYFINGKRYNKVLCDNCICTLTNGETLDIPIEDGSVLHVNGREVIRCGQGYTLSRWWAHDAEETEEGFIDEYATWNSETQEWKLKDDKDGALLLSLTPGGYVITEHYCTRVNGYFYKPAPIFFKDSNEDTQKFFGVELEVMDGGETDYNAKKVCHNHEELYAKHDGSLTDGMELVSHPCTVSWHLTRLWDDVLSKLRSMHYNACSGSGIHVHVSKKYWENNGGECRIVNLITFFDMNREALRLYANRDRDTFYHWAHQYMSPTDTKKVVANTLSRFGDTREAMRDLYDRYTNATEHYSVVNLSNEATVEIRAFASTLDVNRMHSIIQFVDVLTELSTEATLGNPITFSLIKTRAQNKGYTELLQDPRFARAIGESNRHVDTRVCS